MDPIGSMRRKRCVRALLSVVAILAATSAHAQDCLTSNDNGPPNRNGSISLYSGQQEFSLNLLQAYNQLLPTGNIFFSPYSTYHALLLAYFITSNTTEASLKRALRIDPKQTKADVFAAYKLDKFITKMRSAAGPYEFSNANRICVDKAIPVRDCIPSLFLDELQTLDFQQNPEQARLGINEWVESQTRNMIKDLLPPGSVDHNTNLVLLNAAYFKGLWEHKFDPALTKPDVFYITPARRTFVDMMHVEGTFNHEISEQLKAHILELPYKGKDISMFILLPPFLDDAGVTTILSLLTLERFKAFVGDPSTLLPRTVQVSLPKFTLEHSIELVPILDKLNVGNLFSSVADFSSLTTGKVSLGNGIHKAKIEVNELGTEAAAATAIFTFRSSRPVEPAIFNCNHPFIYLIFDKREQAILFTGVFRSPY